MIIIGGDVVYLYPNLDTTKIVENLDQMIRESGIKWSNLYMMEGVRYLAFNWTREQVRASSLRRIIPWRSIGYSSGLMRGTIWMIQGFFCHL